MQILRQGKTPENYPIVEDSTARVFDYVPNERTALAVLDEFIAGTKTFAEVKSVRKNGCLGHIISSTVRGKSNV